METYEDKIKKSFEEIFKNDKLNQELVKFLVHRIIHDAVEFERDKATDLKKQAKYITNSLISKATELKI